MYLDTGVEGKYVALGNEEGEHGSCPVKLKLKLS